ncbi:MAG: zinc metallopeptidase, partial [Planctomycetota bacterium]|nr:zinc metallopeptidase [Planctomycetota bacterium]
MKWRGRRQSDNVVDTRRSPGRKAAVGGGLLVIVIGLVAALLGKDPTEVLNLVNEFQGAGGQERVAGPGPRDPQQDALAEFAAVVLADTEDVWHDLLDSRQQRYQEPGMRIFTDSVETGGCGHQSSAVGPFYCPGDNKIYLELGFFNLLEKRMGAGGDFARAYVIAHEVGHHIQNLTGYSTQVHEKQKGLSEAKANALSVRLELQADFLAGVWAHYANKKGLLEAGDLEEALNAASQIGDDVLQRKATGRVGRSESFTHGTGAQRVRWFRKGFETGDVNLM